MSQAPAEQIRELYENDPIAADLGVELIAATDDSVHVRLIVTDRHVGAHGRCHGGVLFTLADIAMSYVGNRMPGQAFATHAAIDFVGAVELGDTIDAIGTEIALRGRAGICDVRLSVGDEIVSTFRGNTLRVNG